MHYDHSTFTYYDHTTCMYYAMIIVHACTMIIAHACILLAKWLPTYARPPGPRCRAAALLAATDASTDPPRSRIAEGQEEMR